MCRAGSERVRVPLSATTGDDKADDKACDIDQSTTGLGQQKESGNLFRVGMFLDFVTRLIGGQAPRVRPMWALNTCGEATEIESTILLTEPDLIWSD